MKRYDASSKLEKRRGSSLVIERATNSKFLKTGSRGPSHPVSGQNRRFTAKLYDRDGLGRLKSSGRHENRNERPLKSQWKLMSFNPGDKSSFQVLVSKAKTALPVSPVATEFMANGERGKATKNLTTPLTRTQVGDSTDSHGETCRHLCRLAGQFASSFFIVVNVGPNPVEDGQLEFSAFYKS